MPVVSALVSPAMDHSGTCLLAFRPAGAVSCLAVLAAQSALLATAPTNRVLDLIPGSETTSEQAYEKIQQNQRS